MSFPSRYTSNFEPLVLFLNNQQLKNPDLLHNESFIHGEWVKSKSGKTFEVAGMLLACFFFYRQLISVQIPVPVRLG
jgi:hypothetical protein